MNSVPQKYLKILAKKHILMGHLSYYALAYIVRIFST